MSRRRLALTLGPLLFHWSAGQKRDFYARIADEAPVDTVYLGEVICSKRAPFSEALYPEIVERLTRAGKQVVFSTLAEAMLRRERDMTAELCASGFEVEINDAAGLYFIAGKAHRIGQYFNVYNEETLAFLAQGGATHFTLPAEVPRDAVAVLARHAREAGAGIEVQGFGRAPLALSARCYHARAHNRSKDNCQFVCEQDADGMALDTIDGVAFLAVNGVQTLSHAWLCLLEELAEMAAIGVTHVRLSPHACDMSAVAALFRSVADGAMEAAEAQRKLEQEAGIAALANGFWRGQPGYRFAG